MCTIHQCSSLECVCVFLHLGAVARGLKREMHSMEECVGRAGACIKHYTMRGACGHQLTTNKHCMHELCVFLRELDAQQYDGERISMVHFCVHHIRQLIFGYHGKAHSEEYNISITELPNKPPQPFVDLILSLQSGTITRSIHALRINHRKPGSD